MDYDVEEMLLFLATTEERNEQDDELALAGLTILEVY